MLIVEGLTASYGRIPVLHGIDFKVQQGEIEPAEGYDVAVINPRFTKPLDEGTTEFFGVTADLVVTFEDHVLPGGYGSSVLELFSEKQIATPVVRIGWPDKFIEHATTVEHLREKYGLTAPKAVEQVKTHFAEAPATATKLANVG